MVKIEEGLLKTINLINSPVLVFDTKSNELKAGNACFEKLSGKQIDEYIGKKYLSLFEFLGKDNEKITFVVEEMRGAQNIVFDYQTYEVGNHTLLTLKTINTTLT